MSGGTNGGNHNKKSNNNQYIPNFIATAPWYQTEDLNIDKQLEQEKNFRSRDESKKSNIDLRHQRKDRNEKSKNFSIAQKGQGIKDLYKEINEEEENEQREINAKKRGLAKDDTYGVKKIKSKALKFKTSKMFKCSNCGSMKHNRVDCLEKQKKVKIQYRSDNEIAKQIDENLKNKIIVRDEESLLNDYDAKRDNYYGYNDNEWEKQIRLKIQKNKEKEEKQKLKEKERSEKGHDEDEFNEDELLEMQELGILGAEKQDKLKTNNKDKIQGEKTIRLLEDRAKYLDSVTAEEQSDKDDEEFASKLTYNPKTRSFLDPKLGEFNERNLFVRNLDGEAKEFEKLKQFSWDTKKKNSNDGDGDDEDDDDEEAKRENNMMNRLASSPTAMMLELKKKKEKSIAKKKEFLSKYM